MFCKPRDGLPTRHLFVGNCGPTVGVSAEQAAAAFAEFGSVRITDPATGKPHLFASFDSAAEASAALENLSGRPCAAAGGRTLAIMFAAIKEEPEQAGPSIFPAVTSAQECGIPGLSLIPEFVSEAEEQALLRQVDSSPWEELARRRVQHYGYRFEYQIRNVNPREPVQPLPQCLDAVLAKMQRLPDMPKVDQLTVNDYPQGVGLSPHIDTHSAFTGAIASLSLAGGAVMEFRRGGVQRALLLPPRSLLVLAGEARYAWAHYIPHRKQDAVGPALLPRAARRVSFTFRQVRGYPCDCQYPEFCDSQLGALPATRLAEAATAASAAPAEQAAENGTASPSWNHGPAKQPSSALEAGSMKSHSNGDRPLPASSSCSSSTQLDGDNELQHRPARSEDVDYDDVSTADSAREAQLQQLEDDYVHSVYDAIAPHFAATRFAVWPKVRAFLAGLPPGPLLADAGCGNGKYFGVRRDGFVLGSDRSAGLAAVAARRFDAGLAWGAAGPVTRADVAVADAMRLPYRSGVCDAALCIAVLHHISSPGRRVRILAELARVLRPGGRALVTVWATDQDEPHKVAKWQPISLAAHSAPSDEPEQPSSDGMPPRGKATPAAIDGTGSDIKADAAAESGRDLMPELTAASREEHIGNAGPASSGTDYFVPWHLPLHRAEAAGAISFVKPPPDPRQQTASPSADAGSELGADGARHARLDIAKRAVVFKRYYHLFEQGELEGLVQRVPGVTIVDDFFDKSNWCVVMQKV